jgi:hypothetical protein
MPAVGARYSVESVSIRSSGHETDDTFLGGSPCPTSRASTPLTSGVLSRHTATWT